MRIGRRSFLAMTFLSALAGCGAPAGAKAGRFANIAELRKFVMAGIKRKPGVDKVVPDPLDGAKFTLAMGDWSSTSDVTELHKYIGIYPEEADTAIDHFVNAAVDAKDRKVDDNNIVAVIRSRDYVNEIARTGIDVLHEPLLDDLMVVYMFDTPDSMSPLTAKDVPGKDLKSLRAIALANVRKWLPKVVSDHEMKTSALYYVEGNTMLSTSLILLDEFWASINARFPGDVFIALPRKDQLFIFAGQDSVAEARARRLIEVTYEDNFGLLSHKLYARRAGRIVAVAD